MSDDVVDPANAQIVPVGVAEAANGCRGISRDVLGLALIGAVEIATAITAWQWLVKGKNYVDYTPFVGGVP
jgi:hypothetical protein